MNRPLLAFLILIALPTLLYSNIVYAADEFGESTVSDGILVNAALEGRLGDNENIGLYIIEWVLRGISITSPENTLFGAISGILNTLVLAFALIAMSKHGLQFLTLTTTKGAPGGNQLSGGVIAIRSSIAIAMLAPVIANGFSPVQLLVKETTLLGAHAADKAVRLSTDYLSGGTAAGNDTGSAITPATLNGISDVIWNIALNETCSAAIDAYYTIDKTRGIADNSDPTPFTLAVSDGQVLYQWGWARPYDQSKHSRSKPFQEAALCGSVAINIPEALHGKVRLNAADTYFTIDRSGLDSSAEHYVNQLITHDNALRTAKHDMKRLTDLLFQDQVEMMSLTALRYTSSTVQQIEQLQSKIANQSQQITNEIPQYAATLIAIDRVYAKIIRAQGAKAAQHIAKNTARTDITKKNPNSKNWTETLNAQGFAALGSYYWIQLKTNMAINTVQQHIAEKSILPSIFTETLNPKTHPDVATIQNQPNFIEIINRLSLLRDTYLTHRPNDQLEINFTTLRNSTDVNGDESILRTVMNAAGTWTLRALENNLVSSTNNDIIINMMNLGISITSTAEVALIALVIASIITKGSIILKFASSITGAGGVLSALTGLVAPFLIMAILIGVVLQFVLPAIPLIKWLVALQSWAIMMFIAIVYAPIWMMSTAAASNEDWVNEKVKDGFIMLAELVLRPLLMVFGFYAAMLLMAVANIGAQMAFPYLIGIANEGFVGIISSSIVLIISVFISYKLITRTFDLIYELPDFIIERMGGRPLGDAVKDNTADGTVLIAGKFTNAASDGASNMIKPKQH